MVQSKLNQMMTSLQDISESDTGTQNNNDCEDSEPIVTVYDHTGHPSKSLVFTNIPRQCWKPFAVQCILHQRTPGHLAKREQFNRMFTDEESRRFPSVDITNNNDNVISGSGMVASKHIYNGILIFVERPLMILPVLGSAHTVDKAHLDIAYGQMDGGKQLKYFELEDNTSEALASGTSSKLGIWRTNAMRLQKLNEIDDDRANPAIYETVAPKLSRINHSCDPNCRVYFNIDTFTIQVRATKNIPAGTEIVRSYFMDGPWLAPATVGRQRQPSDMGLSAGVIRICVTVYER